MIEEEGRGCEIEPGKGGVKKYAKSRENFENLGRGSPAPVCPQLRTTKKQSNQWVDDNLFNKHVQTCADGEKLDLE